MKKVFLYLFFLLFSLGFVSAASYYGESSVTLYGGTMCVSGSTFSYWSIDSLNETVYNSSGNVGNCSKYYVSSVFGSSPCCPTGYDCSFSTGKCVSNSITSCAQYNSSESCNSAPLNIASSSVESQLSSPGLCTLQTNFIVSGEVSCVNASSCSCSWNSSTKKCGNSLTNITSCSDSFNWNKTCNWEEAGVQNLCDSEGRISISYSASGSAIGLDWCKDMVKDYPCSASVQLPFFSFFNVLFSILSISFIYFFLIKKKS